MKVQWSYDAGLAMTFECKILQIKSPGFQTLDIISIFNPAMFVSRGRNSDGSLQ